MKMRGEKNKCRKGDEGRYEREQRVKGCMDEVADRGWRWCVFVCVCVCVCVRVHLNQR